MALLESGIDFTGRLGDFVAYRMKGCKRIVLRRRGGPSAKQIKKDPNFGTVRLNNQEFGARSKAMSVFVKMLQPHKMLSDYNYSNVVSTYIKIVQDMDTQNVLGCRSILFSMHPDVWEGFSLNEQHGFDTLVAAPLACTITRETRSAQVKIPELIPGVNLSIPASQSLFRIQAALGLVPDFIYQPAARRYVPSVFKERIAPHLVATPWMPCLSISPASVLTLQLPDVAVSGGFALMVSIGIGFGKPVNSSRLVTPITDAGAAKVLSVQ